MSRAILLRLLSGNTEGLFVLWAGRFAFVKEEDPDDAPVNPAPSPHTKQTGLLPQGGKLFFYSGSQNESVGVTVNKSSENSHTGAFEHEEKCLAES